MASMYGGLSAESSVRIVSLPAWVDAGITEIRSDIENEILSRREARNMSC